MSLQARDPCSTVHQPSLSLPGDDKAAPPLSLYKHVIHVKRPATVSLTLSEGALSCDDTKGKHPPHETIQARNPF